MASLTIPENELPSFSALANLGEKEFSGLIAAVKRTEPAITPKEYASELSKTFSDLRHQDLQTIVNVIFNVSRVRDSMGVSADRVADLVLESISELEAYKKHFTEETGQLLRKRIVEALSSSDSLRVSAKALNVMVEHERILLNARILSDIRPVFTDSLTVAAAGLIVHNLGITFRQDGKSRESFFALDDNDIKKLKDVIERAEAKSGALKSILKNSGVRQLSVKPE